MANAALMIYDTGDDSDTRAARAIATAMAATVALWFAPYVSGIGCNLAESKLIKTILQINPDCSDAKVDRLFWFLRKKMLLFSAATYVPWLGVPLQILEVYAVGQFTIQCAERFCGWLPSEDEMQKCWLEIEERMFSGDAVVDFYDQFSSSSFPKKLEPVFVDAVDMISNIYRHSQRIPGVSMAQELAGEGLHQVVSAVKNILKFKRF